MSSTIRYGLLMTMSAHATQNCTSKEPLLLVTAIGQHRHRSLTRLNKVATLLNWTADCSLPATSTPPTGLRCSHNARVLKLLSRLSLSERRVKCQPVENICTVRARIGDVAMLQAHSEIYSLFTITKISPMLRIRWEFS